MRFLSGILVLMMALSVAWFTGEYVEDIKQQLVNEKEFHNREMDNNEKLIAEAVAEKESAISEKDNLNMHQLKEKLELQNMILEAKRDRDLAIEKSNNLQLKLVDAKNSVSNVDTSQMQESESVLSLKRARDDLSAQLSSLRQQFDILDRRLTTKNQDMLKLRTETDNANSIVTDLFRIEELKDALMRLPSSVNVAIPDDAKAASSFEMMPRRPENQATRVLPLVRPASPLITVPAIRPTSPKAVEKRPSVVVRRAGNDSVYPKYFGLPSGLPSGLRPIGY